MPSEPPDRPGRRPLGHRPRRIPPAHLAAAADDRAHRAHVARLLRRRGRARRRTVGRLRPQPRRARRRATRDRAATTPDVILPGETAPGDPHPRRPRPRPSRRSRPPIRRPRTSSSPAPTTTPASIPTRRTPARSATARTSASAATRSWCGASNPSTNQVAVLSFPRDLYVTVDGGSKARINSAYRRDDPSRLQDTIFLNFRVPIDHYIQVDFCAFKRLVDAVGGVKVPFEYPARDPNTGLDVPASGGECFEFDGDHALAYVRSRHYEYLRRRRMEVRRHLRLRPDLAPAGLPASHGRQPARPGRVLPERGDRPAPDQPPVPHDRHRAHGRPDARVRRRAAHDSTRTRSRRTRSSRRRRTYPGQSVQIPQTKARTCRRSSPSSAARHRSPRHPIRSSNPRPSWHPLAGRDHG